MRRLTLKGIMRIADDQNKHNREDNWTWKDVIFGWMENGNVSYANNDFNHMSKKETLVVLDWAAQNMNDEVHSMNDRQIYYKVYTLTKHSLMNRL